MIEFTRIFAPLKELDYFCCVSINPDLGTICWENGADIDPVVLYRQIRSLNPEDLGYVPGASRTPIHDSPVAQTHDRGAGN